MFDKAQQIPAADVFQTSEVAVQGPLVSLLVGLISTTEVLNQNLGLCMRSHVVAVLACEPVWLVREPSVGCSYPYSCQGFFFSLVEIHTWECLMCTFAVVVEASETSFG